MTDEEKQQLFLQLGQISRLLRGIGMMLTAAGGAAVWWFVYRMTIDHWGFNETAASLAGVAVFLAFCAMMGKEFR